MPRNRAKRDAKTGGAMSEPVPLQAAAAQAATDCQKKFKIRRCRRTCADDSDTDREILRQIVCEERSDECAVCRKILSKGIHKGK